jgi:MFS family permease
VKPEHPVQPQSIPRTVWVLGFASLFMDISSELIHSVLPLFLVNQMRLGASFVGLVDGAGESIASCLKLFSGVISDHFKNRKVPILLGYGLSALVKPLFAIAVTPHVVLLARCLDRVGKGIRVAPRDALVADVTSPDHRGAAYGLRQSLDSCGAFIGPLTAFAFLVLFKNEYRWVFWISALPAAIAVLILFFGVREQVREVPKIGNPFRAELVKDLDRRFWILVLVAFISNLGNSSDSFILLKSQTTGITPAAVPLILVITNIAYAGSSYFLGRLSDKLGRSWFYGGGLFLYSGIYLGFAFAREPWQMWCLAAIYGLYFGLTQGTLSAMVADCVPQHCKGTAFGLLNLAIGVSLLPASLAAGFLCDKVSPSAAFELGSVFSALAFVLFFCWKFEKNSK